MSVTASQADTIVKRALEVGRANKLQPLTVAVLDAGGHLVAFHKEDGASIFREAIARGKAMGALGLGTDSANLAKVAADRPAFIQSAFVATGGQIIPVPGGVLIKDHSGKVIGAVGISGDVSEADEACGIAGIRTAGLSCAAIKDGRDCHLKAHL
ncbi:Hypothetical Protein FCC1311_032572 [Hondaea fermentalgiana]|uniref:Heme-binding protein n=1 Tax=Hondaea fermentalgiana TaxID=2315210 RepID=A0A2R5GGP9_9STRA|nr:Hypothetical Protein FCC1311_032572 [Hondaea fermentalgiana]|eukprot:GBG27034.1 Hypothetical Protein FCC1311_032572 [Hondaea fermentalgiana]